MGEYMPPYTISNRMLELVSSISEKVGRITSHKYLEAKPHLIFWYIGGIVYVMGGLFFITRIPEKYIPNKFDYCFHSDNNLHICALLAFIFHFCGAFINFIIGRIINAHCNFIMI